MKLFTSAMPPILLILLFFILSSLWGFYISIRPPKIVSDITPKDLGLEYKNVSFLTKDGLKIYGWFIPSKKKDSKTIILLHGYPADKGDILPTLSFLNQNYNLFLFDFRYLGRSEGKYSTAGARETEDLSAALKFLESRGIQEFGVWGFSMGGAVGLMASSDLPEIKALVSESSYARLDLMAYQLYRIPLAKYPLAWLTIFWAKIFLGVDPEKVSPAQSAKKLQIPVLIIHSKNDEVIPFKHALLLKEALKNNPRAEFWFKENLIHGELRGEYRERIENFFKKHL